MAFKASLEREPDPKICPRCKHELITIDGNLVKWLTCINCSFKKLVEKEERVVRITPMKETAQTAKPAGPQKLRVSFDE